MTSPIYNRIILPLNIYTMRLLIRGQYVTVIDGMCSYILKPSDEYQASVNREQDIQPVFNNVDSAINYIESCLYSPSLSELNKIKQAIYLVRDFAEKPKNINVTIKGWEE